MATMADVAGRAGVSISTVSHVVNGTRAVAEPTRVAVLAAIEEMGYTPNTVARTLATAKSNVIGLAVSSISNPYFTGLVHEIEARLADHGYVLLLADPHEDPARELRVVQMFHEQRVDGLLIAPGPGSAAHALRYLAAQRVPAVLVDRLASADFDQVGVENVQATAFLVAHLADLGHRLIGFVSERAELDTIRERRAGFELGLANAGLRFAPELVVSTEPGRNARQGIRQLWDADDQPSALVVANNQMTIETVRSLRDLGLRVPRDVALVSFDDFEWADLFHPRLTTMAQPVSDIGREAVRLLLSRIENPSLPPRTVRLEATFMHRESCGCALFTSTG